MLRGYQNQVGANLYLRYGHFSLDLAQILHQEDLELLQHLLGQSVSFGKFLKKKRYL